MTLRDKVKERAKKWAPKVGFPIFYLFSFVLFASWTFPYEKLKERIVLAYNAQQRGSGGTQELAIDEMTSSFITGVKARGVHLLSPNADPTKPPGDARMSDTKIDEAKARISLLGLLIGNKDISFTLTAFGGSASGDYDDRGKDKDVDVALDGVDLAEIEPIASAIGLPMEGKLSGTIKLALPEGKVSKANGAVNLEAKDMAVGDGKAKLQGMIALPRLTIGSLTLTAEAKEGQLKVSKLAAGGKDLELSGDGKVQLRDNSDSTLDMNVKFKVNDGYRGKNDNTKSIFGAPGGSGPPPLIDLAELQPGRPGSARLKQAKCQDGFYSLHLRGPANKPNPEPACSGGAGGAGGAGSGSFAMPKAGVSL
jgi:type II secretion system protein N